MRKVAAETAAAVMTNHRIDRALFTLSTGYFRDEQFDRSEALLKEILEEYPGTSTASRAMLGLSEVFAALNDREQERAWLLKCAQFELTEQTVRSLMDTDNTRSVAHQRLAATFERDGKWAQAFEWWTKWQPESWCGTCSGEMAASRAYHMALCQLHMNQHATAAKTCLDAIENNVAEWGPDSTVLLFEMYRRANQLGDLVTLVGADKPQEDESWKYTAAGRIYHWKEIPQLEQQGALAELIKICQESTEANPRNLLRPRRAVRGKLAAEALARSGAKAVAAIRDELKQQENLYSSSWLLYALGRSESPDAFRALKEIVAHETPCQINHLMTAISLHGEAGKELLQQLTEHQNTHFVRLSRERLEQMDAAGVSDKPWPATSQGALPRGVRDEEASKPAGANAPPASTLFGLAGSSNRDVRWAAATFTAIVLLAVFGCITLRAKRRKSLRKTMKPQ